VVVERDAGLRPAHQPDQRLLAQKRPSRSTKGIYQKSSRLSDL
jgi:hypothetical protein